VGGALVRLGYCLAPVRIWCKKYGGAAPLWAEIWSSKKSIRVSRH